LTGVDDELLMVRAVAGMNLNTEALLNGKEATRRDVTLAE
jgi:hypothetical protein